ncbi:MAG: hypothetical protein QRY74_01500 [Chlamydia sp.]
MIPKILKSACQYIFGNSSIGKKGLISQKFRAISGRISSLFSKKESALTPLQNQLNPTRISIQKEGLSAYIEKKSQPKKPLSFFARIGTFFNPLLTLFRSSSQSVEQEKLKFTMNLFKNEDSILLEQLYLKKDLPFSSSLRAYTTYLSESLIYAKDIDNHSELQKRLKRLINLQKYQEQVESIQTSNWSLFRWIQRSSFQSKIEQEIRSLNPSESLFIPGGYYGNGTSKISIYEIVKKDKETYTCHIFDLAETTQNGGGRTNRESIESTITISANGLSQFLKKTTEALTGNITPPKQLKGSKKSTLGVFIQLFKMNNRDKSPETILEIALPKDKISKNIDGIKTEKNPRGDLNHRLLNLFIKNIFEKLPDQPKALLREEKLLLKATTLLELSQDLSKEFSLQNATGAMLRSWMKQSIASLEKSIQKIGDDFTVTPLFDRQSMDTLLKELRRVGEVLGKNEQNSLENIPTEIKELQKYSQAFDSPIVIKDSTRSFSKIQERELNPSLQVDVNRIEIQKLIEQNDIQSLEKAISRLEKLRENRNFNVVKAETREFFFALNSLKDRFPSKETSPDYIQLLQRLQFLLIQSNWGMGLFTPSSEDLLSVLTSIKLQDQILRLSTLHANTIDPYVDEYVVDIHPLLLWASWDPFFSFGSSAKELAEITRYFEELNKKRVDLLKIDDDHKNIADKKSSQAHPDIALFERYQYTSKNLLEVFDPQEKLADPVPIQNGKIQRRAPPPEFFHLRQSTCLAHAFINPSASIDVGFIQKAKIAMMEDGWNELSDSVIAEKVLVSFYKKLTEAAQKNISIAVSKPILNLKIFHTPTIILEPVGLNISALNNVWHSPPTLSGVNLQNGISVPKMATELLYQTTVTYYKPIAHIKYTQAGDPYSDDRDDIHTHSLIYGGPSVARWHGISGYLEHEILQDNKKIDGLSEELTAQLRLCCTNPEKSKASNILGFMQENIALMNNPKIGPFLGQLFENAFSYFIFLSYRQKKVDKRIEMQTLMRDLIQLCEQMVQNELLDGGAFLFGTSSKILKNFEPDSRELQEISNEKSSGLSFYRESQKKLEWIEKLLEAKSLDSAEAKIGLFEALLLRKRGRFDDSTAPIIEEAQLLSTIKDIFIYKTLALKSEWKNPANQRCIELFEKQIQNSIQELLKAPEKRENLCHELIGEKINNWVSSDGMVWKSGIYQIDFSRFQILTNGVSIALLPLTISQSTQFMLFKQLIAKIDPSCTPLSAQWITKPIVEHQSKNGIMYELTTANGACFRIVHMDREDPTLHHMRTTPVSKVSIWYQYLPQILLNSDKSAISVPNIFQGNDLWIDENKTHLFVEKEGKTLWNVTIKANKSGMRIQKIENPETKQQIVAWSLLDQSLFLALDKPENILVFRDKAAISSIFYPRLGLQYRFDQETKKWGLDQIKGYKLSNNSLESLSAAENSPYEALAHLFNPSYTQYHILEDESGGKNPLLIIPGTQFQHPIQGASGEYTLHFNTVDSDIVEKMLFQFEIDTSKGLIPKKQPEGYLYLAYCLFMQGNIKDAFFYLSKITNGNSSPLFMKILSWSLEAVTEIKDSPEKQALLFRYAALMHTYTIPFPKIFPAIEVVVAEFEKIRSRLHSAFSLTKEEIRLLSKESHEKGEQTLQNEIKKQLLELTNRQAQSLTKNPINSTRRSQGLFQGSSLESALQDCLKEISKYKTGLQTTTDSPFHTENRDLDPLSLKIRNDLQEDWNFFIQKLDQNRLLSNQETNLKTPLKKLQGEISYGKQEFQRKILESRRQIFQQVTEIEADHPEKFQKMVDLDGTQANDQIFHDLLYCFGEQDFGRYAAVQEKLQEHIIQFLLASIQYRHLEKIESLLAEIQRNEKEPSHQRVEELSSLLNVEQHYDPKSDPLRESLLLIEYELEIICHKSQIEAIQEQLMSDNLFTQKICGSGKTSLLRNVISHLQSDGVHLSIISTLAAIMQQHASLLEKTTKGAYGERVFTFDFSRSSKSDRIALLQLYSDLLQITLDRGRVQLSKKNLQCLGSVAILKIEEASNKFREMSRLIDTISGLSKGTPAYLNADKERELLENERLTLHKEIDVMNQIILFMKENAFLIADEIDKEMEINEELNFAIGSIKNTCQIEKESALSLFRTIFTTASLQKIAQAIEQNNLSDLPIQHQEEAIDLLADTIAGEKSDAVGISAQDLCDYLRTDEKKSQEVYTRLLEKIDDPQVKAILQYKNFLLVLKTAFSKKCGVHYGISSQEEEEIIPYSGSDMPKKGSEHGSLAEKLIYTVLYYLSRGISLKQAESELSSIRSQATGEQIEHLKKNPQAAPIPLHQTAVVRAWCQTFGIDSNLFSEMSAALFIRSLNPLSKLLLLQKSIFPRIKISEEKLTSNAHDLVEMVKSYSGFSGTNLNAPAAPDKMNCTKARQAGADGEIINALAVSEKSTLERTFIQLKNPLTIEEDLTASMAEKMKWGDCLCDVGCLYAGISAENIAKQLLQALPATKISPHKYIWFIDRSGHWKMLSSSGVVMNGDEAVRLENRITIFDDVHTRGTDRPSITNAVEYVTIASNTNLTNLIQGAMRERGLTKGKATICYLLSPALEGKIESLLNLLDHCIQNESRTLKPLFFKAERQKIAHILKSGIKGSLIELTKEKIHKKWTDEEAYRAREIIHGQTRRFFFLPNEIDAAQAGAPRPEENARENLDRYVEKQIEALHELISQQTTDSSPGSHRYLQEFYTLLKANTLPRLEAKRSSAPIDSLYPRRLDEKYLPEKVRDIDFGGTQEIEVEIEVEVDQEVEVQQIQNKDKPKPLPEVNLAYFMPSMFSEFPTLYHQFYSDFDLPESLRSKNKWYTENFCPTNRTDGKQLPSRQCRDHIQKTLITLHTNLYDQKQMPYGCYEIIGSRNDIDRHFIPYKEESNQIAWVQNYSSGDVPDKIQQQLDSYQALLVMDEMIKTKLINLDTSFPDNTEMLHDDDKNILKEKGPCFKKDMTLEQYMKVGPEIYKQIYLYDPAHNRATVSEILLNYYKGLCRFLMKNYEKDLPALIEFEKKMQANIMRSRPDVSYQGSSLQKAIQNVKSVIRKQN